MLDFLIDDNVWKKFLDSKINNKYLNDYEKNKYIEYIESKSYLDICRKISAGLYQFSIPKKNVISKKYTEKKRIVYSFNEDEMMILKLMAFYLYKYDYLFSYNLYSFRKSRGVNDAIRAFMNLKNIKNMYGYKLDISNYFNSINQEILLDDLKDAVDDDIYIFMKNILTKHQVMFDGKAINEDTGGMAGIPIAAFFANFYIREIDYYFASKHVVYFRYSDDIILFANTKEELDEHIKSLHHFLEEKKLNVNYKKVMYIAPGNEFEFLGFSFCAKEIGISSNSIKKIKQSIHHNAKMLLKWSEGKKVAAASLVKVMNRKYNRKFYGRTDDELSWKFWYFPYINRIDELKIVDKYLQDTERFVATKKHTKKNYKKFNYAMLKESGYRSLVNEYYKFKRESNDEKK